MQANSRGSPDSRRVAAVELREDVPLKAGASGWRGGAGCCAGGPRLILAAFAALSAAITLALLTQIYYGDYEVVPHGSTSSSAAACSRAGTDALKAGGGALDAAAAAALCLAVLAPHRTSLDASGSLVYWAYRESRSTAPTLYEWSAAGAGGAERAPRLLAALATLHAQLGALPWARVLQPAIELARYGFPVSDGLALAGGGIAGSNITAPELATFLQSLLANSSAELSSSWGGPALVRASSLAGAALGAWRVYSASAAAARALPPALLPPPDTADDAQIRVVQELQKAAAGGWSPAGVSTALAVVDSTDTYIALGTGLSVPFGSGPVTRAGWTQDNPSVPLDLAPAILVDGRICGTRYVVGAESSAALAQGAAALVTGGAAGAVERGRVAVRAGGQLAAEAARAPPAPPAPPALAAAANASLPYAAVNLVQQRGDALASHADSRGGGLASRF